MTTTGWIAVALAVFVAGWFVFDGSRALVTGDYVTPKSGPRAGQLGGWAHAVTAVGIEPRSTLMKTIFVTYGLAWLAVAVCFVLGVRGARVAMIVAAAGSLWYMPVGTVLGLAQLALLLLPALRGSGGGG